MVDDDAGVVVLVCGEAAGAAAGAVVDVVAGDAAGVACAIVLPMFPLLA